MSTRFLTNAAVALLGGVVVVLSRTLAPAPARWTAFGIAIGVVALSAVAQADHRRGLAQRALDTAVVGSGGVLIALGAAVTGPAATWVAFGLALGWVVAGFAGLTLNEVGEWRQTHRLDGLHGVAAPSGPAARIPAAA